MALLRGEWDCVATACDWAGQVGELNANIDTLVTHQFPTLAATTTLSTNQFAIEAPGDSYKQINAPFAAFATSALAASTVALKSDDATYTSLEASIAARVVRRDALAASIRAALDVAAFGGQPVDSTQAQTWVSQPHTLLPDVAFLAAP